MRQYDLQEFQCELTMEREETNTERHGVKFIAPVSISLLPALLQNNYNDI